MRALAMAAAAITLTGTQAPEYPVLVSPERNWSATLRIDARALHDDIAANHPGPVNPEDPGFARQNEAQFQLALRRAEHARTYADYFFALREYVASFNDGHLGFGAYGDTPSDSRWPGFLTTYQADGSQRVVDRAENAPVPLGARLLGCDGRSADQLSQELVGRFVGRWSLLSQRLQFGSWLFSDEGNPYIRRPVRCMFDVAGRRQAVVLNWRPIGFGELIRKSLRIQGSPPRDVGTRTLADGTRWVSLGTFDSQAGQGGSLPALMESLRAGRAGLAAAPAIVLDLRGNGGGSSDWSSQLAEIIWGGARIDRLPSGGARVDWRVSAANLSALREGRERLMAAGGLSQAAQRWFDQVATGLAGALARGESLWRQPEDEGHSAAVMRAEAHGPRRPVFFITDAACASACLDAVDLWTTLGAVHIGQTTGADSFYMEVRSRRLPTGLGNIVVPMKVYRGRSRGANQPVVPVHAFAGDIADTAALERWIAGLPERRRIALRP
jgi:hypothetical protein